MPIYFFWGEDDFALGQKITKIKELILDPNWISFNYHKMAGWESEAIISALHEAITPPFGVGGKLVWLENTTIAQQCSETLLAQLQETLPAIGEQTHLLFTSPKKPDGRLKSTKLLQKYGDIREFSPIPPWKTEEISHRVGVVAQEMGVKLTPSAVELLAESVGNNSRRLHNELEKLRLFGAKNSLPLPSETIATLVNANTQNSLQLATAIREGNTSQALTLVTELLARNEPPLRIVATLVGQFRTWTMVRLHIEAGERDDKAIATAAEVNNPKRVYFLRKEVQSLSSKMLLASFPLLLELEMSLKQGANQTETLQTKVIELCSLFAC